MCTKEVKMVWQIIRIRQKFSEPLGEEPSHSGNANWQVDLEGHSVHGSIPCGPDQNCPQCIF